VQLPDSGSVRENAYNLSKNVKKSLCFFGFSKKNVKKRLKT